MHPMFQVGFVVRGGDGRALNNFCFGVNETAQFGVPV